MQRNFYFDAASNGGECVRNETAVVGAGEFVHQPTELQRDDANASNATAGEQDNLVNATQSDDDATWEN